MQMSTAADVCALAWSGVLRDHTGRTGRFDTAEARRAAIVQRQIAIDRVGYEFVRRMARPRTGSGSTSSLYL